MLAGVDSISEIRTAVAISFLEYGELEVARYGKPLLAVDSITSQFAATKVLEATKNRRDWSEVYIVWKNNVRCLVQR